MKQEVKIAVAVPLRTAIWNWVGMFPDEYNEAIRTHRRLEGTPERVFDLLWDPSEVASARALWPTLAALAVICRGAARARPEASGKDLPIHANVSDYIHEVQVSLRCSPR